MQKKYDIIGDIHGHADKLAALLELLGYRKQAGIYRHPESQVIFLGDFIDRGPQQRQVIDMVRPMVESGQALAVMGNHEYNAICYHSKHCGTGLPLRPHSEKNCKQHQQFLNEYPLDDPDTRSVINWFKTLPLYLDLPGLRVIHACWDQRIIEELMPHLGDNNCLRDAHYENAIETGNFFFNAIETLLKGPEVTLPEGSCFYDKDGNERKQIRVKWWSDQQKTYRQTAIVPESERLNVPDMPILQNSLTLGYPENEKPVFFGHYWFSGIPEAINHNVACLDYSAGKGGKLVAYRWKNSDTESATDSLSADQFVCVTE